MIQTILASSVLHGLANAGRLPKVLAKVYVQTRTPLIATPFVAGCSLEISLFFPIDILAERTSQVVLIVFILINLSLLRIKWRGDPAPEEVYTVPGFVPIIGLITCLAMLVGPVFVTS